jgi:hypothetical protein
MRATCTTNARATGARMLSRALAVTPELRAAAVDIARELRKDSQSILSSQVYGVPIPRSPTGRPLWRRTGQLYRRETWRPVGAAVRHQNLTPYARHRRNLGLPGHRQPKYTRSVQWYEDAVRRKASWIRRRRQEALRRALARR